ncbi:MAG: cobalamin-dependent protein [Candidatus Bathyarchaeota archaeon]|jgi:corrinoid protein of di/trimethylamine methyltransferase|nr:MAG: cobalamin-dependent protein [Candidatus Bathyarchaeota archaeon]
MSEFDYSVMARNIVDVDEEGLLKEVKKALDLGLSPGGIITKGLGAGLKIVGDKYESGEFWLTNIVASAEIVQKALRELIEPEIVKRKEVRKSLGKVIIGTVEGDVHDIGKNIVIAMLIAEGFEVFDIGKDAATKDFIDKIKEVDADVVGASAMLTTTALKQKDLADALKKEGLIGKVQYIVGGVAASKEWAEEIGASYALNGIEAPKIIKRILGLAS